MGARRSYNPKNKGKKSFQPLLTFIAETREFVGGELRNGDRPTGKQIAKHLESVMSTVPKGVMRRVNVGRMRRMKPVWHRHSQDTSSTTVVQTNMPGLSTTFA
jgi:hypothetical protein